MKKIKIVLFTLLLSIVGDFGITNAASVNNSNKSAGLVSSTVSQSIQNSSLSKNNIENSKSEKYILWSPRIKTFKKGDQVKILLPHGKYKGKSLSLKVVSHGEGIATLTLEYGSDYGMITFMANVNSDEITQIIAGFSSMDFGEVGTGCVNDSCTGNTTSKIPSTLVVEFSSLLSNQNDDSYESSSTDICSSSINTSSSLLNSKSNEFSRPSSLSSHWERSTIDYDSKSVSIILSLLERSKSSLGASHISASSANKDIQRHSYWKPSKLSSSSKDSFGIKSSFSTLNSSSIEKLPVSRSSTTTSSLVSSQSSSLARQSNEWVSPFSINKGKYHPVIIIPVSKPIDVSINKVIADAIYPISKPIIDLNGVIHINPQQVQALKRKMYFSNSKAINAVKEMDNAADFHVTHYVSAITSSNSKQKLMMKPQNVTHLDSNVRRVILPIRGILPATRMDSHTWIYSLVGLAIMIISGKAFFSKKKIIIEFKN